MRMLRRLISVGRQFRRELKVYRLVLSDPRTPRIPKILLALALGYAVLPFDVIPDFIPVIGHLDDAIIVPVLVILALKMIPSEIVEEHRRHVGS